MTFPNQLDNVAMSLWRSCTRTGNGSVKGIDTEIPRMGLLPVPMNGKLEATTVYFTKS